MSIATLIASGAANALSIIKQFVAQPNLAGMPIAATRFDCVMEADVSRHVVIDLTQNNKKNVMDNVAPGPRTWEIEGYIGGLLLELTSLYMPSLALATRLIDDLFQARTPTVLITPYFNSHNVLISRFEYSSVPDVQNRVPVRISLVEVTSLTANLAIIEATPSLQSLASPAAGSPLSAPLAAGVTESGVPQAQQLVTGLGTLPESVQAFAGVMP
jgi:hypothetical protein